MEIIETIEFKGVVCELAYGDDRDRMIRYQGVTYRAINDWLNAVDLGDSPDDLTLLAKAICFICGGERYQLIENCSTYHTEYQQQIKREELIEDIEIPRTRSWGVYDTREIKEPRWNEAQFECYAEDNATGVPYKVIWERPTGSALAHCSFQLLPMIAEVSRHGAK